MKKKLHSLIDKVYDMLNLRVAWEKVRSNRGAGGIDQVSIEEYEADLGENLEKLQRELREGTYRPLPVRRVWIDKPDGRQRPLGVPAINDRVCQQAVLNVIGPHFESMFHERSYGFRPGRSTHMALRVVWVELMSGRDWVVDLDIQSFFDSIPHERLIDMVAEEISDGRVLKLIRQWLKAGIMEDGSLKRNNFGTPQGGVISPLLANIYLHKFDTQIAEAGFSAVRYADDVLILCGTRKEANSALIKAKQVLEGLGLKINPKKTTIGHISQGFESLGYFIKQGRKKFNHRNNRGIYVIPRKRTLEKFKDRIREITRRANPITLEEMIKKLNQVICGWGNYFRKAHVRKVFWFLDTWIRLRVYSFISKRWKNRAWQKYPGQKLYGEMGLKRLFLLIPGMESKCTT